MSVQGALKLLRLELGLTQEDLAKKLNKAFITVNRWENGKGFPSRANARAILDAARNGHASGECIAYLNEMLLPDFKRSVPAVDYGFPDIDRDFLFQLADGSTNALYVIEAENYRMLYANRQAERNAVRFVSENGISTDERRLMEQSDKRCFHYFGNRTEPCPFCPLAEINDKGFTDVILTIPEKKHKLRVHAKKSEMNGKAVYVMYLTDITQEDAERNALYELTNDIPVGVGVYHVYLDGRIELSFMNNILFNMIGEERGKKHKERNSGTVCLDHPEDKPLLMDEIKNSISEKRDISITIRMNTSENQYEMIHIDAKMIRKDTERFTYYCLMKIADV